MIGYTSDVSLKRLAECVEAYLRKKKVTEKWLEGQVRKSHSVDELRIVMDGPRFPYLKEINPQRFEVVREKFLK